MSTYMRGFIMGIRMNEGQMISSLVILQEKIDERHGNTITLGQTILFLEQVIYEVDFNEKESLLKFIENFLNELGMEK